MSDKTESMICCSAATKLPPTPELQQISARHAIKINPYNAPSSTKYIETTGGPMDPSSLAVVVTNYWGVGGVDLTVDFIDVPKPPRQLRDKIVTYMNKWNMFCNVRFTQVSSNGRVRISLKGEGYWSYLGTDIDLVAKRSPTMNLQGFSLKTPDSEFDRVVVHETGHTLGFPHEHLRPEIVQGIDQEKAIDWFARHYGWSREMTIYNVLTPLDPNSIRATEKADTDSIMCYWSVQLTVH